MRISSEITEVIDVARDKQGKLDALERQMRTGANFKADTPDQAFVRPSLYRRRVSQYFEICDNKHEHYTVPGLALFLGLRSRVLMNYDPGDELEEYRRITDFALQRIEAYTVNQLFTTKGSTKGIEFLAQNSLGYANKSDVNSKQAVEITEKERLKSLPDSELKGRILHLLPRLQGAVEEKIQKAVE